MQAAAKDRGAPRRGMPAWQREMAAAVRDVDELLGLLGLSPADFPAPYADALAAARDFPLRVPHAFVERMRPRDPADPLLLQVLPLAAEKLPSGPGFSADPLEEAAAAAIPGLLHKYRGRALLVATGACAVHCRYCFRRHFPYAEQRPDWQKALDYLAADDSIEEILLSGGDPLSLADEKLSLLVKNLSRIPHLKRLRVHSRVPIVLPSRVDDALLSWLCAGERWQPVLVLHANHARELDATVKAAVSKVRAAGVTVLNQSVLLRGVNDDVGSLADLSRALFESGILPYYLHLLDRVEGAGHFAVEEDTARGLSTALLQQLPGYLVPKLVREVPGAPSKVAIQVLDP
jgi:EF-P beta-lysylation protein EpmB